MRLLNFFRRGPDPTVVMVTDAYKDALSAIVESQKAQNALLSQWFELFRANGTPTKGWINDDRREWLEEQIQDKGEGYFPTGMTKDEQLEWLEKDLMGGGV